MQSILLVIRIFEVENMVSLSWLVLIFRTYMER